MQICIPLCFLSEEYSPVEVMLRTSGYPRAQMSASATLAGLYADKNIPAEQISKHYDSIVDVFTQFKIQTPTKPNDRVNSDNETIRYQWLTFSPRFF